MSQIRDALLKLPEKAPESMVWSIFMPTFFRAIGYNETEVFPEYSTGGGEIDFALRHNQDGDTFLQTGANPHVLVEIKGRDINLAEGATQYRSVVRQIKKYLLSSKSKSVNWGMITNSCHIQLFRKHGKVIHPATQCLEITENNIEEILRIINQKIHAPQAALTVAIYNNKGGVGKTTTTINLAAILTVLGKRVLVVDFDPNQKDLTTCLDIQVGKNSFYELLEDIGNIIPSENVIQAYSLQFKNLKKTLNFDVLPCDTELENKSEPELLQNFKFNRLKQILDKFKLNYDYILIDSPPNWRFFSISAVTAADVVLIPTKHNDIFSLKNAATVIGRYIPEIQAFKKDGTPIALPIFWNGEKISPAAKDQAQKIIDNIIKQTSIELLPYFYPRFTKTNQDRYIFELPGYANIANAAFANIPAVYKDRSAHDYYQALAQEYFLQ